MDVGTIMSHLIKSLCHYKVILDRFMIMTIMKSVLMHRTPGCTDVHLIVGVIIIVRNIQEHLHNVSKVIKKLNLFCTD